jgi:1,2-diacylglycerol 3-beta-galactosyltransferase
MASQQRVPLVLFLIADTGGGHRSAANAIRAAMDVIVPERFEGERPASLPPFDATRFDFDPAAFRPAAWKGAKRPWRAEIRDAFQECGRYPVRRTANMYGPVVQNSPRVYASFYYITNIKPVCLTLTALTQQLMRRGLIDLFEKLHPDVIVSIHPMITLSALNLLKSSGVRVPFLTVVTDLVSFHRAWSVPGVDACSVPTPMARDLMIDLGMPPHKLRLLGMPIHPKFCLPPADRIAVRRDLGLQPDRFTALLVGGGDGVGGLGEAATALMQSNLPIQLIVVTGRNRALYRELSERQAGSALPAKILGFVENMPDLMRAADVIVTKAGPGTIMEALSCGLPIVLTGAIPGQEEGNVAFVEDHQVGMLARSPERIIKAVSRLLSLSDDKRAAIGERARSLSTPRASFEIARLILSYLPSLRAVSAWERPRRRIPRATVHPWARRVRPGARGLRLRERFNWQRHAGPALLQRPSQLRQPRKRRTTRSR